MPEIYQEKFGVGDRGWMVWALRLQERWAARFASAVLTVEERYREILATRGVQKHKISVLMNLPDERVFKADPGRQVMQDGSRFVLVYHGTLARRLGLDVAIEAVSRLRAEIPGLQLRIIGAGEERDRLVEQRDHLGLGQVVTFSEGFVPLDSIPALLADADVGVVPLRASPGTDIMLPTKLLEYVSRGIPCVVPRTGTICRYFDAEMVQFFEAGDPASLAVAILALYRNPERRAMLAEAASSRFIARYKWSEHKRVYVDLVERLLAA
jgi:glycosyltransferase involved in cell wall biosynthesis